MKHSASLIAIMTATAMALESPKVAAIDLNFGFTVSKSTLGVSYVRDGNELNLGLKRIGWSTDIGESDLNPGLTYIRSIGSWGQSVSAGIISRNERRNFAVPDADSGSTGFGYTIVERNQWIDPVVTLGVGHTLQRPDWGLHVDANLGWPLQGIFGHDWQYTLGIGLSHRFTLNPN